MSITPHDLMSVSHVMIGDREISSLNPELRLRQAASRAYYAAFHVVHEALIERACDRHYTIMHKELITWLIDAETVRLNSVGNLLKKAKALRVTADYRLSHTISTRDAEEKIARLQMQVLDDAIAIRADVLADRVPIPPKWDPSRS